ncbi:MAG: hypothetical protein IPK39_19895 [Sulfuritalea sp.]|nr:hypothetical protein [Sulfuritalea sp.]
MRKTLLAAALAGAFSLPSAVLAQTADPSKDAAAPASPHTIAGNLSITSDYRFRGITQTFEKPALQGGIDYSHSSGFYLGNWNSNVSSGAGFPDGNLEMDFYGGYKMTLGDFGLDFGGIYYYYPGSEANGLGTGANSGAVNNKELYIGATWKFMSLKYFHSVDDYFSLRGVDSTGASTGEDTKGSNYWDLSATYDLGGGWGINGHVGWLTLKNVSDGDYTDWKIGVTKDIGGWVFGAAYVDTNASGQCSGATSYQPYCFTNSLSSNGAGGLNIGSKTKDAGEGTLVVSVSKAF